MCTDIDLWAYGHSCLGKDTVVRPVPCSTDAIDVDVGIGHGFDKLGKGDWIGNT